MEEEQIIPVNSQNKALFDYYMENFSPKEKSLYEKYKTSNWGLALDAVGAAADIASTIPAITPVAGTIGAIVDIPITGLALYDGFKNGFTTDHFLDMGKMIPFGSIARQGLKSANKTAKYVRRASPYSQWAMNLIKSNPSAYMRYYGPVYTGDVLSIGLDGVDMYDRFNENKSKK